MTTSRRVGKRGRKPAKVDVKAKLERSRQSARECRARKKLRYQYLEELVASREKAIYTLRKEMEMYRQYCAALDKGKLPPELSRRLEIEHKHGMFGDKDIKIPHTKDWCELTLDSSDESQDPEEVLPPICSHLPTSVQSTETQCVGKGKGPGKSSTKQTLAGDRNIGATCSTDGLFTGVSAIQSDMDNSNIDQQMFVATGGVGHLGAVSMTTGSPFAMDTPALDTSYHCNEPVKFLATDNQQDMILPTNIDINKPTTSHQEEYTTINTNVLFSDSGSSSQETDSSIIKTFGITEMLQLDQLHNVDIGDLLDIIEKQNQS